MELNLYRDFVGLLVVLFFLLFCFFFFDRVHLISLTFHTFVSLQCSCSLHL